MFRRRQFITNLGRGGQRESGFPLVSALLLVLIVAVSVLAYGIMRTERISPQGKEEFLASAAVPMSGTSTKARIIEAVGKMTVLPNEEEPVLGTVQDPALLQDQPFFRNAMRGDRVLIYQRAKRAILYRPSTGQIIETMPFEVPLEVRGQ